MKRFLAIMLAGLLSAVAFAKITVEAPTVVGLEEQFKVTFCMTEKPSGFEWEPGGDFQLVWGPSTGSSTSVSIVNGKTTKSSSYTYTYVLLPKSTGRFTLPAAHASINGEEEYSASRSIEVVGNGATSSSPSTQSQGSASGAGAASAQQQDRPRQTPSEDIFMRFSLSRTNVVMGEPITATLKLYTRGNISGFEDAKFPTFNGFWSQETESPQSINFVRESVGDKIYNTAVLRRWVLIPQKTGAISIDPAELVCLVQQRISSGNSVFDGFFDDFQTIRKRIFSSAYTVNVSALPAGAPASFTGAVGDFKISASMGKDSLSVHDAASLTLKISGRGNVALVGAPKVKFPPDSEVYDTKTTDNMDAGSGGTSGYKVFEYPFIPRSHGDFEIAPVEFTYYDIKARKYVTLKTQALPYHVAQGTSDNYVPASGVTVPTDHRRDVKNLSEDIHFISTKLPAMTSEDRFFVGTSAFWILFACIFAIGALAFLLISRFRKERADVALVRTRGASKAARKRLAMADAYLRKNLYSAFYEELHKALLGYASDKMNISAADLSKESIYEAFRAAGAPEALASEYSALLDRCEFARYAPDSGNQAMQDDYDKAITVISTIDDNMKSKSRKFLSIAAMLLVAGSVTLHAENMEYVDSLWYSAVNSFSQENYSQARETFSKIAELGLTSPELYTNLADSYYKEGALAPAILNYERALKLDPSYKDARYNLAIASARCQDRIESVPELVIKTWNRALCYKLSSNTWAVLGLALLALTAVLVLVFLLSRSSAWRKTGFFCAIATLIISVFCLTYSSVQKKQYQQRDSAIVFRAVCSAKSSPSASSGADLFILHEGTKVKVLDTVGDWTRIVLADGREGWVVSKDITII